MGIFNSDSICEAFLEQLRVGAGDSNNIYGKSSDLVFFLPFSENTNIYSYQYLGCNGFHVLVKKTA